MNFCFPLCSFSWRVSLLLLLASSARGQALRPQEPAHRPKQSPCLSRKYVNSVTIVADGGPEEPYDSLRVYPYVRQMPSVPGTMGGSSIYEMLQCLLVIPAEVRTGRVEGTVYVNFTVERTGAVSGARIQQGLSPACDAEALAAVARLPRLEPGRLEGRPVAVAFAAGLAFWGPEHLYANWAVAYPARFPAPGIESYVYKNRQVPTPKRQRGSPQVRVDFVVGANGWVREARVIQSVSPSFDQEALRLVQAMPRWTPARTYQGDAVAVRTELVLIVPAPAAKPGH